VQSDDLLELLERERLEPQSDEPTSREGMVELERRRFADAHGHQDSKSLVAEPVDHEPENISGRRVEPLRVVDRHHCWPLGRRSPKHALRTARHADTIRRTLAGRSHKRQFQR
jgi:hypothetical protein